MNWQIGIKESHIFLVIGTRHAFEDAICFAQAEYAKSLGKPFRILLKMGTEIPKDYLKGVTDYKIEEFHSIDDIKRAAKKLLTEDT